MDNSEKGKVEQAQKLCDAGKFEQALVLFRQLAVDSTDPSQAAGYLLDEATCRAESGDLVGAEECVIRARNTVAADALALAQAESCWATLLVEGGERQRGLDAISKALSGSLEWRGTDEGRNLYEKLQVQRAFTLMYLSRQAEASLILEEALSFVSIGDETRSSVHCHLGRHFCETGDYKRAQDHFIAAQELGLPSDWEAVAHYYLGYAMYELRQFDSARRELILSLQSGPSELPTSYQYKMLAAISRKLGEHDRAREYAKLARSSGK